MKLLYPIGKRTDVQTKTIKIKAVKVMSQQDVIMNGDLHVKLLCSFTDLTEEEALQVADMDSTRILFDCWKKTHQKESYVNRVTCECGAMGMNVCKHSLDTSHFKKDDVYGKEHIIRACDDEGIAKDFRVVLKPVNVRDIKIIVSSVEEKDADLQELLGLSQLVSVNGSTEFDIDELPIVVWIAARKLVEEDMRICGEALNKSFPCKKCGKELLSTIGFYNGDFLLGS